MGITATLLTVPLWWEHRENMREYDEMAQSTRYTPEDIPRSTMNYVRALLGADTAFTDREVLQRLGALRSDGKLSQAAALTLCPASRTLLEPHYLRRSRRVDPQYCATRR